MTPEGTPVGWLMRPTWLCITTHMHPGAPIPGEPRCLLAQKKH